MGNEWIVSIMNDECFAHIEDCKSYTKHSLRKNVAFELSRVDSQHNVSYLLLTVNILFIEKKVTSDNTDDCHW